MCRLQIGLRCKKCRKRKRNMDLLVYIVRQNSRVVTVMLCELMPASKALSLRFDAYSQNLNEAQE
jgi:hypothetical protein